MTQFQHLWRRLRRPIMLTMLQTRPISGEWGFDRGMPVDRHYIERFLGQHQQDIRGHVLEIKNSNYTKQFGSHVTRRDVLDINASNPHATIVADLTAADAIRDDQFDCFIITQTLQFIYDVRAAVVHAHRMLRPGGVLLATVPGISRIAPRYGLESDYWRFTLASSKALFGEIFGEEQTTITSHGNVLSAMAFLTGAAREELSQHQLDTNDPYFPLIISIRAVKS